MAGTIPQEIQRIEDEVATQAAKIATVSTILTDKGSTSNAVGETASTPITQNTADLDALIAKADALPDAGSGGGAAVETCTVTINYPVSISAYVTTIYINGKTTPIYSRLDFVSRTITIENVLCNTVLVIDSTSPIYEPIETITGGGNRVVKYDNNRIAYATSDIPNGTMVIDVYDDD